MMTVGCSSKSAQYYEIDFTEEREACSDFNKERNAYFGDTHVHTSYSFDAFTQDVRTTPDDAYGFAQGGEVLLPPLDENGVGTVSVKLDRGLDFVAVTDHSEFFGEIQVCIDPDSPGYNSTECQSLRAGRNGGTFTFGFALTDNTPERWDLCGENGEDCTEKALGVWQRTQEAAEGAYDRSGSCEFTSFVGYEYSAATNVSNLHRNVIFRNADVPDLPTSYYEQPRREGLWKALDENCVAAEGNCDVLIIPHNSNLSNGNLFAPEYPRSYNEAEQKQALELRARMEPLVEIYQHKSDSECMNGLSGSLGANDELCDFEKYHTKDVLDCEGNPGSLGISGGGCVDAQDFVRNVLVEGMAEQQRLGVNPFKLGITASTDTHNGTPGAVSEEKWQGHVGMNDVTPQGRMDGDTLPAGGWRFSPGGITGVWAQENSRDAIFEAMRRKEVWGTSGPQITVRFFGSFDFESTICDDPDLVTRGYEDGVPMGGDLVGSGSAPGFVVSALRESDVSGSAGVPLEKLQIIKGWIKANGERGVKVYDVVTDTGDYQLDQNTCSASGTGADTLCGYWQDPDFDPGAHAYYYVRVVEYPRCRWTTQACLGLSGETRPAACDNSEIRKTLRERAWTSPIWYSAE